MNISEKHQFASRYSGKALSAAIMLMFVFATLAIFIGFGSRVDALSKHEKAEAQLAALNSSKVLKPQIGVVRGIVYNPSNPTAVIDETMVHVGDTFHGVTIVGIQSSTVEFSKDGVTWQQTVLEAPHAAWTNSTQNDCPAGK